MMSASGKLSTLKKFLCPGPGIRERYNVTEMTPFSLAEQKEHKLGAESSVKGHRAPQGLPTVVMPTALQLPRSDATSYRHIATHDL